MALEKWHPLKELEHMKREMDRLWEEFFPASTRSFLGPWRRSHGEEGVAVPLVDVIDRGDEVVVKAEMPGVDKDHIDISIHENTLTIKGEIKKEKEYKEEDYYLTERTYRSYARTLNIPVKINPDKVKANLREGILEIHLPKSEDTRPKKIKVDVA